VIADAAQRAPERGGEMGGAGRLLEREQDGRARGADQGVERGAGARPGWLLPQGGHAARRVDEGGRPRRLQGQRHPGPDEDRGDEQQPPPAELGVLIAPPAVQLDPALRPAQVRVQVGQRGGPAAGGKLPGPVHHVALQDRPQRAPFRLEQRPPGRREHIGRVGGEVVAGQQAPDPRIGRRPPPHRLGHLAADLVGWRRPDLVQQLPDRCRQVRGHQGQEIGAPSRRVQRQDHLEIRLPRQRPVPVTGPGLPGTQHRVVRPRIHSCQQPQRMHQLPQRGHREPALGQVLAAYLDPQRHALTFRSEAKDYSQGIQARTMAPMTSPPQTRRPPSAARTTYRSVFAAGEFRVLFAAQLMYVLGFQFEILGLSVLVYAQTRSPFWAALAFGTGFAPYAVGGALFTSLADRLPPRTVIVIGLLTRAAPGLVIGLWPRLPVPAMLAGVAAAAMVGALFSAATSSLLPEVLDGDRYVLGRSVFSVTSAGTQILGLGIGSAVLAVLPAQRLLLAAGISLVVAAVINRLGLRPRPPRADRADRAAERGVVRTTLSGHAELLADRQVRGLLLVQWLPAWFVTSAEALVIPYAGSLGRPASAASPVLAAAAVGMLLGNMIIGRFCRPRTRTRLAFPLVAGMGTVLLAFIFRPPLPVAGLILLAAGFGFAYQLGIQQAFLDSLPPRVRGQAFGLLSAGMMGGQGLLPPLAGVLASALGAAPAMAIAGAATVITALALRASIRETRRPGAQPRGQPANRFRRRTMSC
jgi:predicted MFS family arabinose efflux permease